MWSVVEYDVCMVCVPFAECANFVECVNLVERVPAQVCEYDICVPCVNFPSLGDKGLEWYIDGPSIDDLHTDLSIDIYMFFHSYVNIRESDKFIDGSIDFDV